MTAIGASSTMNIALDAVDRQASGAADGHRTALIAESDFGVTSRYTFEDLSRYSGRLARLMSQAGLSVGAKVAIALPPGGEAAIALLAALKIGAVAAPVPPNPEDLAAVLPDSGAAIVDRALIGELASAANRPRLCLAAHAAANGIDELWASLILVPEDFPARQVSPADPALLCRAGGRTVLYAHAALRARLPGIETIHRGFPQPGDMLWTAADWAAEGGWLDSVLPAWCHGTPVVATPARAEDRVGLLTRWGIRNVHIPAHRMDECRPTLESESLPLRSLAMSGPVDPDLLANLHARFAVACPVISDPVLGFLLGPVGRLPAGGSLPYGVSMQGSGVDVIGPNDAVLPAGKAGEVAVHDSSPRVPLEIVDGPPLPRRGRWIPLGFRASKDLDGVFWPDPPLDLPERRPAPDKPTRPRPARLGPLDPADRWR